MNVTYNNKPAIMRRNGRVVLGDTGGITFQFIAIDLDGNELGATEQIKVETVSTETVTEVQATFVKNTFTNSRTMCCKFTKRRIRLQTAR